MERAVRFMMGGVGMPEARQDSAALLAAIVDSSSDAIVGQDLDGRITSWNRAAELMFGYTAGEMIGHVARELIPPDRLVEWEKGLQWIASAESMEPFTAPRVRKDGTLIDVTITKSPILDAAGSVIGTSTIARDISERAALARRRRELEGRLRQSERLETLGQLAGGIAHDFNNLLGVILNYTDFVGEELDDAAAARADLSQIRTAAERASALTRQLLAFAGREVQQPEVVNLNAVIEGVADLLRRTIGEKIDLVVAPTPDLWSVVADSGQLEQVLVNLAVNARDAMPDGGTLTIDTGNVEIDQQCASTSPKMLPGRYVRLRVSDTGLGMPPSVLDHAFEPFFTTKAHGEGTGLGLPMVFGIANQAGGEAVLYSELGIGTTVHVLLPATEEALSAAKLVAKEGDLAGNETIMVVEDEDALREVTRRMLVRNGYQVLASARGVEAIALAEQHSGPIDLLLTDVVMPQMLGKEVASRIGQICPGVGILFMSGYAQPVLGSTLGDDVALLEKPFSERLLLSKVRELLDLPAQDGG